MQELIADGDTSSLYYTARGLMRLQSLYGTIPQVKGKGSHALAVKNMMTMMRKEMGAKAPRTGLTCMIQAHKLVIESGCMWHTLQHLAWVCYARLHV